MRRLLLAVLLPVLGMLAYAPAVARPAAAFSAEEAFQKTGGAEVNGHYDHSDYYLRTPQLASSSGIRAAGGVGGEQVNWGVHFAGALPTAFIELPGCSKAFLKEHLRALLARFTYQQRLALYPKHWFW